MRRSAIRRYLAWGEKLWSASLKVIGDHERRGEDLGPVTLAVTTVLLDIWRGRGSNTAPTGFESGVG